MTNGLFQRPREHTILLRVIQKCVEFTGGEHVWRFDPYDRSVLVQNFLDDDGLVGFHFRVDQVRRVFVALEWLEYTRRVAHLLDA